MRIFSPAEFLSSALRLPPVHSPMDAVHMKCRPHSVVAKEKPYPDPPMSCLLTITIATEVKMFRDHANASNMRFVAGFSSADISSKPIAFDANS